MLFMKVNDGRFRLRSESANAYVRKWGCDLISPEPHKKNVTYRSERKEMPDERWMKKMSNVKTHMWANDDLFRFETIQINRLANLS